MLKKLILIGVVAVVGLVLLIQLVPYGRDHSNPPVTHEAPWSSPQVRQIAARACYDCHSNETVWPWYSNIAPISWLLTRDVQEGRQHLNFSEWGRPIREPEEMSSVVLEGEMPPIYYLPMHPSASLTGAEKQLLAEELLKLAATASR